MADSEGNSAKIRRDSEIVELARRQHGHVARSQVLRMGVSQGLIAGRLKSGAWVAVHAGVYCIGPRRDDPISRAAAAVLTCGPDAVLSHWLGSQPSTSLQASPPSNSPAWSTTRCAAGTCAPQPFRTSWTATPCTPAPSSSGPSPRPPPIRRPPIFEDEFLAFVQRYGLPTPQINVIVHGREVDAYFPDAKLIVEADGWAFHNDRQAFESDRERDAENLRHGLNTLRITKQRMHARRLTAKRPA